MGPSRAVARMPKLKFARRRGASLAIRAACFQATFDIHAPLAGAKEARWVLANNLASFAASAAAAAATALRTKFALAHNDSRAHLLARDERANYFRSRKDAAESPKNGTQQSRGEKA